jgi:hypothetical protein
MRGEVRTLAARLRVERGERVSVARVEASAPEAEIHITPGAPRSGDVVHLAVTGEELAQVAWRLEEDATFVGPEISHLYRPVGDELVHVFVISSAGVGAELTATVKIETREVRGCGGCGAAFPSGSLAGFADLWLFGLVLLRMGSPRRNRPSLRAR